MEDEAEAMEKETAARRISSTEMRREISFASFVVVRSFIYPLLLGAENREYSLCFLCIKYVYKPVLPQIYVSARLGIGNGSVLA